MRIFAATQHEPYPLNGELKPLFHKGLTLCMPGFCQITRPHEGGGGQPNPPMGLPDAVATPLPA